MKKVLYIGWIGYANLGDELMYDLFKEEFKKLGESYILDVANIEHKYLKNVSIKDYDLIVLGGGSIFGGKGNYVHPYIINYLYDCILLNKKVMIWGTGIDWLPKELIDQLENNVEIPLNASDKLRERINIVLEESVWSGVRGPLAFKLLYQYGVKECQISGDPGFLLNVDHIREQDQVAFDLATDQQNEKVIGVNWGTSFNNIYGGDELEVEEQLADALNQLIEKGYHIYLYTVWNTDLPAIERLYSRLCDSTKVTLDKTLYNHNQLLSLMQNFTFTINFKLHANYISLAANVPFIALGYRFKIFDFVKSVDLEDFIISTDAANISDQILSMESEIIKQSSEIKSNMNSYLTLYRDRISEPFKHNLYL